jgi:hypothetical protein
MPAMWFDLFGLRGCKVSKWSCLLDIVADVPLLMCMMNESLLNGLLIGPLHCIDVDVIVLVHTWRMGPTIIHLFLVAIHAG